MADAHPRVIALVGSAGALDALFAVLGGLAADLPAAVVVLLHQTPDRESRLAALLDKRTALPVRMATDGATLLAGEVVVVPAGRHLVIGPGLRTVLIGSGASPPSRPSADLLLTTLAVAAGPGAYAVVLSGHGHDGATGATAVSKFGGTVLATTEASSVVFSMPRATIERDDIVDHVVPLPDVAALLSRLVGASVGAPPAPAAPAIRRRG